MDWTATILAAANGESKSNSTLDGINLLPVLTGKSKAIERTLYWRTTERSKHKAIRMGNWKYLKDEKGEYLFDLSIDPTEKNNLSEKFPGEFAKLKDMYAKWESTVLKPLSQ